MIDKKAAESKSTSTHSQSQTHYRNQPVCGIACNDNADSLTDKTWKKFEGVYVSEVLSIGLLINAELTFQQINQSVLLGSTLIMVQQTDDQ